MRGLFWPSWSSSWRGFGRAGLQIRNPTRHMDRQSIFYAPSNPIEVNPWDCTHDRLGGREAELTSS